LIPGKKSNSVILGFGYLKAEYQNAKISYPSKAIGVPHCFLEWI
jgi:hypothetical protein